MKVTSQWISGSDLSKFPPANQATAIIAIKDYHKGRFFILPEVFVFDKSIENFVGESHGMPQNSDFWYMLEDALLLSLEAMNDTSKPNLQLVKA